jgi:hypothetical protein
MMTGKIPLQTETQIRHQKPATRLVAGKKKMAGKGKQTLFFSPHDFAREPTSRKEHAG